MSGWRQFWEQANRIYVNDRHRAVHYTQVADDILSVLPTGRAPVVLDYGCGDALEAGRVAERCAQLCLYDASHAVQARLQQRFAGQRAIRVLDDSGLAGLALGTVDLIVINSVIQYLTPDELGTLLEMCSRLVAVGGVVVVADVIPPDAGGLADITALLGTAVRHGFLPAALVGLAATTLSDYRRLRRDIGRATHEERAFLGKLTAAGFSAERHARNFGFNPRRMTFLARKPL
jgi:SAM-dependent methyltransferase